MKFFEINALAVPIEALQNFKQTYSAVKDNTIKRKVSGAALSLSTPLAAKISTQLSGDGYAPHGLSGVPWGSAITLKCAEPQSIMGAGGSNVITIPAARRTDTGYTPVGIAIVGAHRRRVFSPATETGTDEFTVTSVTGATGYMVAYYPQITVIANLRDDGRFGWQISAEQV